MRPHPCLTLAILILGMMTVFLLSIHPIRDLSTPQPSSSLSVLPRCPSDVLGSFSRRIGRQYDRRVLPMHRKAPALRDCDLTDYSPHVSQATAVMYRTIMESVRGHRKQMVAVDLGCGCGLKLIHVAKGDGWKGIGLDASRNAVDVANAYAVDFEVNDRVHFCQADALAAGVAFRGIADLVFEHTAALKMAPDSCEAMHDGLRILSPRRDGPVGFFRGHVDEMSPNEYFRCVFGALPSASILPADMLNSTLWMTHPNRPHVALGFLSYAAFTFPSPLGTHRKLHPPYYAFIFLNVDGFDSLPLLQRFEGFVDK